MSDVIWSYFVDYNDEPDWIEPKNPIPEVVRHQIACFLLACRRPPMHSSDVAGELTSGYGRLDSLGYWEYPL